jgi:ADP-ribosylglycohydrolase
VRAYRNKFGIPHVAAAMLPALDPARIHGALLGCAIGDALAMPLEGLSHQNVRTYYRGIRDFRPDEKRGDLAAGQWTGRTQALLALSRAENTRGVLPSIRDMRRAGSAPPAGLLITAAGALGVRWGIDDWMPEVAAANLRTAYAGIQAPLAASFGHALAVRTLLRSDASTLDGIAFVEQVAEATAWAEDHFSTDDRCSTRLTRLAQHLDLFPLDLQDLCGGTGAAPDEAWPFAVAMLARQPGLVEASLLSAINVGGDAPTVGACLGTLLGALHGVDGFPPRWRTDVEGAEMIAAAAGACACSRAMA